MWPKLRVGMLEWVEEVVFILFLILDENRREMKVGDGAVDNV